MNRNKRVFNIHEYGKKRVTREKTSTSVLHMNLPRFIIHEPK